MLPLKNSGRWLVALILLAHGAVFGQTSRGGIAGYVLDASGAVVPTVTLMVVHVGTGLTRDLTSSTRGDFVVPDLPIGSYAVTASKEGFQTWKTDQVEVAAGKVTSLSISLAVAQQAETIKVSGVALAIETQETALNSVLPTRAIEDIPLNGRNFVQLLNLTPGFNQWGSMNGNRAEQNNWQIDGADNNDFWFNGNAINQGSIDVIPGVLLPIDTIDQLTQQAGGGANAGRNPGSIVNAVLKSGSNQVHGTAFYFHHNNALAATDPFTPLDAPSKLRNHSFGGTVGGPLATNRAFYFLAYEGQQYIMGSLQQFTVPSDAWLERARSLLQAYHVSENPVMDRLLTLWTAQGRSAPATAPNFYRDNDTSYKSDNFVGKIDYIVNHKHSLILRSFDGTGEATLAPSWGDGFAGSPYSEYFLVAPTREHNYAFQWTGVFTPRLVNQILAGVNYFEQIFDDANHSANPSGLGFNTGVTNASNFGTPFMAIGDFATVGSIGRRGRIDTTGQIVDDLSLTVGSHAFNFGAEFRRSRLDVFYQREARGSFFWDGTDGPWKDDPNFQDREKALADFLAGFIGPQKAEIAIGDPQRVYDVNSISGWAQDNWQVSPRLTLNLGLRYEYNEPLHDTRNSISTFLPSALGGLAFPGQPGSPIKTLYPRDLNNFAPRVGFAFTPTRGGKTVIRAAYGLFYDLPNGNLFIDNSAYPGARGVSLNPGGPNAVYIVNAGEAGYIVQDGMPIFGGSNPVPPFGAFGVNQNLRSPYVQSFNVNVQRQLAKGTYIQIAYVGNQARKLMITRNINQPLPDPTGMLSYEQRQPYNAQFPQFNGITEVSSSGNSQYNSLQFSAHTASWHGLTGRFAYTLSHARDDMSQVRNNRPTDNYDLRRDYSNSDFDTRHGTSAYLLYDVPSLGTSIPRLSRGWQLNAFITQDSGFPFSVYAGQNVSNSFNFNDGVDVVGDPFKNVPKPVHGPGGRFIDGYPWFNPAAFVLPAPGSFGSSKRNQFYGPGFKTVNFSVLKHIPITERLSAQLRIEIFNIFDFLNLSMPENCICLDASAGLIYGTSGSGRPINAQVALKLVW